MGLQSSIRNLEMLDSVIEPMLRAARIPGAAIAIVADQRVVFAKGYGYRDLAGALPVTTVTVYPIASTTKAFNATLLGTLVDDGLLGWDVPVRHYLPRFFLGDAHVSALVTVRDLVTMRTGLARHDWLWLENTISRASLFESLRHLKLSSGFRERFQYNNVTVTLAGYLAEVLTGQSWDELIRTRLLEPLSMSHTSFSCPTTGDFTLSYHEGTHRQPQQSRRLATSSAAPAGGSMHSTLEDMARWISFNLSGAKAPGPHVIKPQTLREVHSPHVIVGRDPSAPSPDAAYAMGWFVDSYNGHKRLSHGGDVHDVNSSVALFPDQGLGLVSFINFCGPKLARLINEHAFDALMGLKPVQTVESKLAQYEAMIESARQRRAATRRVPNTAPSHALEDYVGRYVHAGYGRMDIERHDSTLMLRRGNLELPLRHWHYDAWVVAESDWFDLHRPHDFDCTSRILFEMSMDGDIVTMSIRLEAGLPPVRFIKQCPGEL